MTESTMIDRSNADAAFTDDDRWGVVQRREPEHDNAFVYAVRSTGIYCRPSCPSRRPEREQVEFFDDAASAERSGYRACRRCRPRDPIAPEKDLVRRACLSIQNRAEDAPTLAELGRELGVSPYHLQRIFKRVVGVTPREYADSCRAARLKGSLHDASDVTEALYEAGYSSSSRLYDRADDRLGMTPNAYRRGGVGMTIAYDVVTSDVGLLLVAATERGLCTVALGDSESELGSFLRREYPAARIDRDSAAIRELANMVLDHVAGRHPRLELPIDVVGTEFQRRVWEALREIPFATTVSYTSVARSIGQPGAARAVARACATNRLAIVVPCHRVLRSDGALGGYRWGLEKKRLLLDRERARATANRGATG